MLSAFQAFPYFQRLMEGKESQCSICGTEVSSSYCPECGQLKGSKETSVKSMLIDLATNLFSLEKSVFSGIRIILTSPSTIITNYWAGNRSYHPSPGKMLFYALTIAAIHVAYVRPMVMGIVLNQNDENPQFLFWLTLVPLLVFASALTYIRKQRKLSRHLISILYLATCFFMLFTVLDDLLVLVFTISLDPFVFVSFIVCTLTWNSIVMTSIKTPIRIFANTLLSGVIFLALVAGAVGLTGFVNLYLL